MYNLSCICFMCLTENKNFTTLHPNDAEYKTTQQVKHLLPELTISELGIPVHICSPCHSTIQSFHEFKTKCLDNYNILKNYIKTTQGTSQDQPMKCVENNNDRLTEQEDVKEETEDPLLLLERRTNQKNLTPDNISIKEEIIESESDYSIDEDCHPFQFIKCEVSDDGQDGGPSKNIQNESVFLTDTDEFQCSICNEKFARYGYLKEHMRSAHAEYSSILKTADATTYNQLPERSKSRYLIQLKKFRQWMTKKNVHVVTEEVVVAYFNGLLEKYAPPSLWSTYSMLKATLFVFEKVDITKFRTLCTVLKSNSKGYQPKKAKTFKKMEVEKFMNEAPDDVYLLMKLVFVMGIMGGCRCEELVNLRTTNIEDTGSILVVKIFKTKNYKSRTFIVTDAEENGFNGVEIYRKYVALRPSILGEGRLFLCYRSGKCTVQPVGINTLSKIPRLVANYLKLKDAHSYTGHCFRRTSATFLAKS